MDNIFQEVRGRFRSEIQSDRVIIHRAESAEAADLFDDGYFDWVYIDGNHLYEYVLEDLEKYYPKIKSGGKLMGDDYGDEGWWDNGVQKAVDEFTRERSLRLRTHGNQFIIQKP